MRALASNELYKAFKGKKVYIFLLILLGLTALIGFFLKYGQFPNGQEFALVEKLSGALFPATMLSGITDFLIPIFIILLVTDMVTDEYQNGTFKLPLLHGVSRQEMFHAKLLAQSLLLILLFGATFVFSYGLGLIFWGKKMLDSTVFIFNSKVYGLTLLPFLGFLLIVYFASLKMLNTGFVLGAMVGLLVGGSVAGQFSKVANHYLITYYLKAFSLNLARPEIIKGLLVSLAYVLVFYWLSRRSLVKMDILK